MDTYIAGRHTLALFELDSAMLKAINISSPALLDEFLSKSQPARRTTPAPTEADAAVRRTGPLGDLVAATEAQFAHLHVLVVAVDHLEVAGCFETSKSTAIKDAIQTQEADVSPLAKAQAAGFVSVQLTKAKARQLTHDRYTTLLSSRDPYQLRREMVSYFSTQLAKQLQLSTLRTQLGRYLHSLRRLLAAFPSTRDYYFLIGSAELVSLPESPCNMVPRLTPPRRQKSDGMHEKPC